MYEEISFFPSVCFYLSYLLLVEGSLLVRLNKGENQLKLEIPTWTSIGNDRRNRDRVYVDEIDWSGS